MTQSEDFKDPIVKEQLKRSLAKVVLTRIPGWREFVADSLSLKEKQQNWKHNSNLSKKDSPQHGNEEDMPAIVELTDE